MIVEPNDLLALSGAGGERFERFVHGLVRVECSAHSIPPNRVHWDCRTTYPDGGVDILIEQGHNDEDPRLIPNNASVWSVKAGADGVKTKTLEREIELPSHDFLRSYLSKGYTYVWCALQAIGPKERAKMNEKWKVLADKHKFREDQVGFMWQDALAAVAGYHPNLAAEHLPEIASRLKGVCTIDQWLRASRDSRGFAVKWVNFAGREELKNKIREHLSATDGPPLLHIAGISGIGKTRTVLEACLEDDNLANTLYAPDRVTLSEDFLRYVESKDVRAHFIVDEVGLEDFGPLAYRFAGMRDRVRLVTIGPARRAERKRASDPMLVILDEPDAEQDVLHVVQSAAPSLRPEVQQNIAHVSGHDLRLALLLAFATADNPELSDVPVRNLDEVWTRVTTLFTNRLGRGQFPERYEVLTSAIDVGWYGKFREEVEYLAHHFGLGVDDLDRTIQDAQECGLGMKTSSFFEAGPRTLALWVFIDRLWPRLTATLDQFLREMPSDRLRRRFIERCQEVPPSQRDDILRRVGGFFLSYLGQPTLARLIDREQSRVFQAWAETDPNRGLAWLRRAVESASDEDLRQFSGAPDGSGGWSGRRQIVWLCEHLACFSEYFWECEAVLFRLAQVETEQSIHNNSTNTWREMFLPVLANTEVPFSERLQHLLGRLAHADERTLGLVLSAALGTLDTHVTRMVPPPVVGGRVVPEGWEPRTIGELHRIVQDAGRSVLGLASTLRPEIKQGVAVHVINDLMEFVRVGLTNEARSFIDGLPRHLVDVRHLRVALDEALYRQELISKNERVEPPSLPILRAWREAIKPGTTLERLIDVTGRNTWEVKRSGPGGELVDDEGETYAELAGLILSDLDIIEKAERWLDSGECISGNYLGMQAGKLDSDLRLTPTVVKWLDGGKGSRFVVGYLSGLAMQKSVLPDDILDVLDTIMIKQPALALDATIHADVSDRGFQRLQSIITRVPHEQISPVGSLAFGRWAKFLTPNKKRALLETLENLSEAGNRHALGIAFDLLVGWARVGPDGLDSLLQPIAVRLLLAAQNAEQAVNDHDWKIVVEKIMNVFPADIARILAAALVDSRHYNRGKYAEELIKKLAPSAPNEVMKELGSTMLDDEKGAMFDIHVFRGLFDAIKLEAVQNWLTANGELAARRVARHLIAPHIDEDGKPVIPPLTDWLLTEFANTPDVFSAFCVGLHSFEVRVGHARDRRASVMKLVEPFTKHEKKWVLDWVKCELESFEQEVRWDDQIEDERERT